MNDGRSIPVERCRLGVYHVTGHPPAAQVGGEKQASWASSNDEHYGLLALPGHRRKGSQKIWMWVGVVNPGQVSPISNLWHDTVEDRYVFSGSESAYA
jgi:hypothetical protein